MKVRSWLLSQNFEGVGSRGVISRAAWAAVARAAEEGQAFDDYDPSVPGKVSKAIKSAPRKVSPVSEPITPTYRIKSLPEVRKYKVAWTRFPDTDAVLQFGNCSICKNRISRCPCKGGPKAPRFTTGEVLFSKP